MNQLPEDIRARVLQDFVEPEPVLQGLLELVAVLERYRVLEIARTLRCVVQYAGGNQARLEYGLEIAGQDYRDAILMGEYQRVGPRLVRVRDLSEPFE